MKEKNINNSIKESIDASANRDSLKMDGNKSFKNDENRDSLKDSQNKNNPEE